jgi:predicted MFS family arabinose efflux permease
MKDRLWTKDFTILTIANMWFTFGFYMMIPLIPLYVVASGGDDTNVGLVASCFAVSAIIMRFITPLMIDKTSKTAMLRFGIALSIVVTATFVFTGSIGGITIMRVLQGVGFGCVSTITSTLAADLLPETRRGEGIGYFGMGTTAMVAFSPAIGLWLADAVSYDAAFLTSAAGHALCLICLVTVFRPDQNLVNPKPADGSITPSFLSKLYDPALTLQVILLVFFGFARSAEQNYLPLLAEDHGISTLSFYYIAQTVISFFAKFATGRLYDKKGHKWAIIPGGICLAAALFFMSISYNIWILLIAAFFSGTGMGALLPAMQTWCVTSVAANKRSTASAVYYNFYDIGQGIGAYALGVIAHTAGYGVTFKSAIAPVAVFLAIYLIGTSIKKKN